MRIVIGADHGGFELKEQVADLLLSLDYKITDVGCSSTESVDYPDFAAEAVCQMIDFGCDLGILICGTGIGMSIAANRNMQIRAANCSTVHMAKMSREHNNANVLCLGARLIEPALAMDIVRTWLNTAFTGGRHQRRIEKFSN